MIVGHGTPLAAGKLGLGVAGHFRRLHTLVSRVVNSFHLFAAPRQSSGGHGLSSRSPTWRISVMSAPVEDKPGEPVVMVVARKP